MLLEGALFTFSYGRLKRWSVETWNQLAGPQRSRQWRGVGGVVGDVFLSIRELAADWRPRPSAAPAAASNFRYFLVLINFLIIFFKQSLCFKHPDEVALAIMKKVVFHITIQLSLQRTYPVICTAAGALRIITQNQNQKVTWEDCAIQYVKERKERRL